MFKGRVFNDTWEDRKTATDLINNPIDVIEHLKRLENYDDPTVSAGREYTALAKINTDSFDSADLNLIRGMKIARQIIDNEARTDDTVAEICRQFFLLNYIDNEGRECLKPLIGLFEPDTVINFEGIEGNFREIEEPDDAYNSGSIFYAYDNGTTRYLKELKITDVNKPEWSAEYSSGFESVEDAQEIWEIGRKNYAEYGQKFNPLPDTQNKLRYVYRYQDALLLFKWRLQWSALRRTGFTLSYVKGKRFGPGDRVYIKSKHLGDNPIECLIYRVTKNKKDNVCEFSVAILPVPIYHYWTFTNLNTQETLTATGKILFTQALPFAGTWEVKLTVIDGLDVSERTALIYVNDVLEAVSWEWDMDDSTELEGPEVEHEYAEAGFYDPVLLVTASDGSTEDYTETVEVEE